MCFLYVIQIKSFVRPMQHFTLISSHKESTASQSESMPEMHASPESLFLIRLFARTYVTAI